MYSRYENFRLSGQSFINTACHQGQDWAAISVYPGAAVHELYVRHTIINFILDGEKRMYNGNRVLHVKKGDILLIPPGTLVSSEILHTSRPFKSMNLVIPDQVIARKRLLLGDTEPKSMAVLPQGSDWEGLLNRLEPVFTGNGEVVAEEVQELVWHKLLQCKSLAGMLRKAVECPMDDMMDLLRTRMEDIRDMSDLAEAGHMSPATLKRRFRYLFDCSPMQWIWTMRLQRAALLLRSGQCPVNEVAFATGFSDISHFYRLFRKNYGCTPVQWRQSA
ncbi:AraC-like DNA-binding protein [Chitinophaga dinghuensis]|uniref:AraC-like DNA-binding protein n=1 Tax=Chitinophaga dinghuensis TaxID=1539050 RepID=A0A327VL01_9BACT|nr:AraC family transcriptional regulator [Chitinophaga dinghuensis]RAJ75172.1 AraC-like DNA-binding protein [Chitinophaga dinghuensis]